MNKSDKLLDSEGLATPSFAKVENDRQATRDHFGFFVPAKLSDSDHAMLVSQPSGYNASGWSLKNIPRNVECNSKAALDSVARHYHVLMFDPDVKNLARHGIPNSLRPTMWHWLSGGYGLQKAAEENLYNKLTSEVENVDEETMDKVEEGCACLAPNFTTNILLLSGKGSECLCDIMYATLQHWPHLVYSHGLHQLAAFMLLVITPHRAEHAFWSLLGFLQTKLYPAVSGQVTLGCFIETGVLELLVLQRMPKLSSHLSKMGWHIPHFCSTWYSRVFTSSLQPEVAARVWDVVMTEGIKAMHRVSLALLMRYESLLVNSNDLHTAKEDLDKALMSIFNKEELMEAAFHGIGSFPGQVLVDLRQKVMTGSAYASFKAQHENDRGMRFEVAPRCISVLSPALAKKSFVSGLLSRISHCGDEEHSLYTAAVDDSLQPAPMMHRVSLSDSAAVKEFVPTDAEKHGLHMAMHVRFSSGVLSHGASKKVESADLGEQTEKEAEELMMAIQASVTIE